MSKGYEKHEWYENELITSANLNHMEDGIEDAYKRADRQVMEIIDNSETLTEALYNRLTDFLVEINEEEQKLIFRVIDTKNI